MVVIRYLLENALVDKYFCDTNIENRASAGTKVSIGDWNIFEVGLDNPFPPQRSTRSRRVTTAAPHARAGWKLCRGQHCRQRLRPRGPCHPRRRRRRGRQLLRRRRRRAPRRRPGGHGIPSARHVPLCPVRPPRPRPRRGGAPRARRRAARRPAGPPPPRRGARRRPVVAAAAPRCCRRRRFRLSARPARPPIPLGPARMDTAAAQAGPALAGPYGPGASTPTPRARLSGLHPILPLTVRRGRGRRGARRARLARPAACRAPGASATSACGPGSPCGGARRLGRLLAPGGPLALLPVAWEVDRRTPSMLDAGRRPPLRARSGWI
jgi:hypothetical protein